MPTVTIPSPPPTRVSRWVLRSVDEVYSVIADPESYPTWLVGCQGIRSIDDGWPRPGSRFHHRVGLVDFLTVHDSSKVIEMNAPQHLALEVRIPPAGRGRVDFHLSSDPASDGSARTRIDMDEAPVGLLGPAALALAPLLVLRNRASLNALVAHLNKYPDRHGRHPA